MADTPSGSTNTPSGSTDTPSGSTDTPSGSTNTPSGSNETPTYSTEYQGRLRRVLFHHDWDHPVYSWKVKDGIYICRILVNDVYFKSDDCKCLAEARENVAEKAYRYWS
ncbi:hypothetical protein OnM2_042047 [Erysiphe neolycopersici]|uniref:Uncharacterized protein n=1 Tax=Erysiphe neolycopersici TaxID=212602 RepID=A0A420HVG2_9PEZI|nr:hypothetical protein OnM2_042047 [Erysiphe neolycopersici]